jgi:hypothetical protein
MKNADARTARPTTDEGLTRRRVLSAGTAAGVASLATGAGIAAPAAQAADLDWQPRLLGDEQAVILERVCDLLLPRTATPGALDAGVPQWIDLAASLEDTSAQLAFIGGLSWLDDRAEQLHGSGFVALDDSQQKDLLGEISDEHENPSAALAVGAAFFADIKRRALFAYFTSEQGRVEALGRPAKVRRETLEGCTHDGGSHSA